jgi:hypothetical protein
MVNLDQVHKELDKVSIITFRERKMNRVILMVMAMLAMATGAQAKNQIYGVDRSGIETEGYKIFVSDKIVNTVEIIDNAAGNGVGYCDSVDKNTSMNLGDINTIRSDNRLSIGADAKISYSAACLTYNTVVERLKTTDDIRRLWLLFADSATDDFVVETLKDKEMKEEGILLIEIKRLAIVSKYVEFFTKNKEWKLTEYTFLSQAFKSRKGMTLSPAFSQFIKALLTGDTEKAFKDVKSVDLDNLGNRFVAPGTSSPVLKRIYGQPGLSE